ncbi:PREDICTED: rho GTPase-activating protein 6-like isoform X2 [Tarenaya hassleriana]|uniref:rho GTPase-activating protein 6-like isoform X2 n=1 Tax=Tarenaya hassleriana TaxID=28532 RepID=UPI00053C0BED|nr:PREDICTED: rho GTPase-activating protein 6-like isoform X2 [Tarenaya hassleriana]
MAASLAALERPRLGASDTVFKSGSLFISSKGLGWKSWKKRWFILTRTSLVFFKNDPSALPQKGEGNMTLGGIDLNSSGSVVVREDKKLLTVLFPDGCDGRAFTLKAETLEEVYEWKTAFEQALAQAPNAALVMGHNGIFRTETNNSTEGSFNQWRDKRLVKSLVVGRPILLALEDIDGSPSFLEKALQFLEQYGSKVEGILRQSADVEEVERRIQEYDLGKTEFSPDEDPHVVGDCVKHVLRELPSPVPASCCTALLEAYKTDHKEARINSLHSAIVETFPEPNKRLLQRILKMMHTIASHSCENRMTSSALAACMAPLLLRPLLAGECDLEDDFGTNGDNSAQLLAAANAANNAQAIVTTLLDDYDNEFSHEHLQRCSISADSHIGNSGPENSSDEEDIELKETGFHNSDIGVERETDEDNEVVLSRKLSEGSDFAGSDLYDYKGFGGEDSDVESPRDIYCSIESSNKKQNEEPIKDIEISSVSPIENCYRSRKEILTSLNPGTPAGYTSSSESKITDSSTINGKRSTFWGRGNGRKKPTNGSFDSSGDDELVIQRLETMKSELRQRIAKEARGNVILLTSLERRKQALHERRLALEQDVARLQEQLQAEKDLRTALEVGLSMSCGQLSSHSVESKTRTELEEIALAEADVARLKQKVAELHHQLNQQRQNHVSSLADAHGHHQYQHSHNAQPKFFEQDFDSTLAYVNHKRNQRMEEQESVLGAEWRNGRGLGFVGGDNRQPPCGQDPPQSTNLVSVSIDECSPIYSPSAPTASRAANVGRDGEPELRVLVWPLCRGLPEAPLMQ